LTINVGILLSAAFVGLIGLGMKMKPLFGNDPGRDDYYLIWFICFLSLVVAMRSVLSP